MVSAIRKVSQTGRNGRKSWDSYSRSLRFSGNQAAWWYASSTGLHHLPLHPDNGGPFRARSTRQLPV